MGYSAPLFDERRMIGKRKLARLFDIVVVGVMLGRRARCWR